MKGVAFLLSICLFVAFSIANVNAEKIKGDAGSVSPRSSCPNLLNHEMNRLRSDKVQNLCDYQGQVVLVVNTASRCGYTPQFKGLEALYKQHKDKGFIVLGFPSNDFNQELSDNKEIARFCEINYGVSFPMFEKTSVKGDGANDFYKGLIKASGQNPQWNFNKYLINRDGVVVSHFSSSVKPDSSELLRAIDASF